MWKEFIFTCYLWLAPLESGSLEINGDKLDAYLNLNWFNKVSYVAQKPHFVGRIVSDNFSISEHSQLEALLLQFGLINSHLTFKDLLVRELDTLSGGQLQKIALARAALKASRSYPIGRSTECSGCVISAKHHEYIEET